MPYHMRIVNSQDKSRTEVDVGLSAEQLQKRLADPYLQAHDVPISGRTISARDIYRIKLMYTDESAEELLLSPL
jgi:hypothetical protein